MASGSLQASSFLPNLSAGPIIFASLRGPFMRRVTVRFFPRWTVVPAQMPGDRHHCERNQINGDAAARRPRRIMTTGPFRSWRSRWMTPVFNIHERR